MPRTINPSVSGRIASCQNNNQRDKKTRGFILFQIMLQNDKLNKKITIALPQV